MTTAVLLSCHGTVSNLDDVPAFLSNIRRGRPAPPALCEEVRRRLAHIGGSPLMQISGEQAAGLAARLSLPVAVAGRLWHPYPRDVLAELADAGARRVLSIPLAPQSVHVYEVPVREAAAELGLEVIHAPPWGDEPALIDAFLETIEEARVRLGALEPSEVPVVLSAHSLPLRVLSSGDPYEEQFRAMAGLCAARLDVLGHPSRVAFQSQGATEESWLGPDLAATFAALAEEGYRTVVVAPIGFVADHVETLYDLDVEGPVLAQRAGLASFARASAVGARPRMIDALEAVARRMLA